jgi:hypothetical protein
MVKQRRHSSQFHPNDSLGCIKSGSNRFNQPSCKNDENRSSNITTWTLHPQHRAIRRNSRALRVPEILWEQVDVRWNHRLVLCPFSFYPFSLDLHLQRPARKRRRIKREREEEAPRNWMRYLPRNLLRWKVQPCTAM